ncbi:MAG TPA: GDSL-type esterase/lipase family protein [Chitinophagales bacterium]|nr:GDSL-type esterase/lipase family protein [Chitinophagales bacterium]
MAIREYTMLSLGDSYTIGERVDEADRFPNQAVMLLHNMGIYFEKPKIIAKTGWTTDELMAAIENENLKGTYDFVTLLIGVNNQYRGRDLENYRKEFIELLELAIKFSGGKATHVIVLSIPDWGATPFAEGSDRKKIATEIDQFNAVNMKESDKRHVHYIGITGFTREHPDWIAEDGLHPDGRQYALWSQEIVVAIEGEIKK